MRNTSAVAHPLTRSALILSAIIGLLLTAAIAGADSKRDNRNKTPLVIGHRGGATGYLPDHTLENYALGIALGVDFVEPAVL